MRSEKGTRRYSEQDVGKLRVLAAAVSMGHKISALSKLSNEQLRELGANVQVAGHSRPAHDNQALQSILESIELLDGATLERLLDVQMQRMGGARFAREIAAPLLREVGLGWMRGELSIAAEHLLSAHLRRLLGNVLASSTSQSSGPYVLVTTPDGERHEFGALIASIIAVNAGASVLYLGPETPPGSVAEVASKMPRAVVLLSAVSIAEGSLRSYLQNIRVLLPADSQVWIGGKAAIQTTDAEFLDDLDSLSSKVAALSYPPTTEHRLA